MRIMNQYSSRTDGSLPPRATECSITLDYSQVDPELATIQVFCHIQLFNAGVILF